MSGTNDESYTVQRCIESSYARSCRSDERSFIVPFRMAEAARKHTTFLCTSGQCLLWRTEKPVYGWSRRSPEFAYMNSMWRLKFRYYEDMWDTPRYSLAIVGKSSEFKPKYPFFLTLYLENSRDEGKPIFFLKKYMNNRIILETSYVTMLKAVPDWDTIVSVTIVCIFENNAGYISPVKLTEEKSMQTSSYYPFAGASEMDIETSSENSPSTSANSPSSLECLSSDLGNMLGEGMLQDVLLKVDDQIVRAHKTVLAARSKVFAAMFQRSMSEYNSGIVAIQDMDSTELHVFLKYIYTGKITENYSLKDMILKLYKAGDKYEVYALKKTCSNYMIRNISKANYLHYLMLAIAHDDQELRSAVISFVVKDDILLKSTDWLNFALQNPLLAVEIYRKFFEKSSV